MRDDEVMQRALALAAGARRSAPPWPWVGCVLVRDGEVVGEAATGRYGAGDHAEVAALRAAGPAATGATAYVTLEPCDHHGTTPPCSEALLAAGVARVVVAVEDPDARVAGRGIARLRAAGVEVVLGVGAVTAAALLAPYLHQRRTGRPLVVAKVAASLDGKVAAADGTSQWITSASARADAHELRADSQAIVIGSGTAIADQPSLTVRDASPLPAVPPQRVVLDARGRAPAAGALFDPALAPTLVVTAPDTPAAVTGEWEAAGARVARVPRAHGGLDLDAVFSLLGAEGVLQVLVEGGGALLGSVLAGGHADRLVVYVAPLVLGRCAPSGLPVAGPPTITAAERYRLVGAAALGDDVRLEYDLRATAVA